MIAPAIEALGLAGIVVKGARRKQPETKILFEKHRSEANLGHRVAKSCGNGLAGREA